MYSRHLLLFLLFVAKMIFVQGQKTCKHKTLCLDAIDPKLDATKRILLKENWNDYSGVDLEKDFSLDASGNLNVVSIRLDGLGCVYPPLQDPAGLRTDFLNKRQKQKRFQKLSFYSLFERGLGESIRLPENDNNTIKLRGLFAEDRKRVPGDFFKFRESWNALFLPQKIDEINSIIKEKHIERIYFFLNGFNVPYALSQLQGNSIFRDILNVQPATTDSSKILFVRVFWPSFSKKRSDFKEDNCNIKNKQLTVAFSGLIKYISNRGYLSGLTLNEIIYRLPTNVQYNLISHSFGSTITSAVILEPTSKMSQDKTEINDSIRALIQRRCDLSDRQMNFFMSAPGMPGVLSFINIDTMKNRKHSFYIGHNSRDKIQLKQVLVPFIHFPKSFSSTTLGCNFKGEADSVFAMAKKEGLGDNFFVTRTSYNPEHDIYCYRRQQLFKDFFRKFVEETMAKKVD